jgi:hypothetical protein
MSISPPTKITVPFATSGLKNPIPANTNNVTGNAGYDAGFGSINMTPKTAGGIPPFGQDFNGIFFDITTALQFLEAGGSFPFDSAFATAVGGYPIGALVSRSDSSGLWRNTVANNTANPETAGTGWQPEDAGVTSITMTNANVTLTRLQSAMSMISISGALTANLQLILPVYLKQWLIINNCTGAFTITVKTAAGSGAVSVPNSSQSVFCDGTNIVAGSSGRLITTQTIAVSGTYNPTPGTNSIVVEVFGAGGGSGGCPATGAGVAVSGGGGGGGYAITRMTSGFTGIVCSIGNGGLGGAAGSNNGATGGSTTFGVFGSANGGVGGVAGVAIATSGNALAPGGNGAPGVGNLISTSGSKGTPGIQIGAAIVGGSGGVTGRGIRCGGDGLQLGVGAPATAGLNGNNGFILVWEYS